MDKKEFQKISNGILISYGFKKINSNYFLDLKDIIIKLFVRKNRFDSNEFLFEFGFSIKLFNNEPEKTDFSINNMHSLVLSKLFSEENPFGKGSTLNRGTCYFNPEDYKNDVWQTLFSSMISRL